VWEVLGIARTTDKAAIRRAYAAKLRSIDSDRDPAAFIQIRQAYEAALAWSSRPKARMTAVVERAKAAEEEPSAEPMLETGPGPQPAPLPEPARRPVAAPPAEALLTPGEEDIAAFADFEKAIAEKRTRDAARMLDRLVARGLIGLGSERLLLYRLAELAVHDFSLSAAEFALLIRKLGYADIPPGRDDTADLRRKVGFRLTADAWLQHLQATAAKRAWGKVRDDVRIARLFLGRRGLWRKFAGLKNGRMLRFIEEYQRHLPWMSDPLDAGRMERIDARYKKLYRRWRRRERIYGILALSLVILIFLNYIRLAILGELKW